MPDTCCGSSNACNCCHGIWKPTLGRNRMLPWDAGRSWIVKNTGVFSLVRLVFSFFGAMFLIFSAVTDKPPSEDRKFAAAWEAYWKFYTHWTLALLTCYYLVAGLFSYFLWKKERAGDVPRDHSADTNHHESTETVQMSPRASPRYAHGDHEDEEVSGNESSHLAPPRRSRIVSAPLELEGNQHHSHEEGEDNTNVELNLEEAELQPSQEHRRSHRRVRFGELCLWLFYETTWASAIFLACTFWLFIGIGCVPRKSCTKINPHFWTAQLLNILLVFVDFVLNKMPFIPSHSIVTFGYCVLWLIFSVILFFVTGHWVYPQDGSHGQLWTAITFWPGWILLNVIAFYFALLIDWTITKFAPQKHSIRGDELYLHPHRSHHHRRNSHISATRDMSTEHRL